VVGTLSIHAEFFVRKYVCKIHTNLVFFDVRYNTPSKQRRVLSVYSANEWVCTPPLIPENTLTNQKMSTSSSSSSTTTTKKRDQDTTNDANESSPPSFKRRMQQLAAAAREDTYLTEDAMQEMRSWICEESTFVKNIMNASERAARTNGRSGLWISIGREFNGRLSYSLGETEFSANSLTYNIHPPTLIPIVDNMKRSAKIRMYFCKLLKTTLGVDVTNSNSKCHFFLKWDE